MSTTAYEADLRDINFVLFEQLGVQDMNQGHFADFDEDMYRMVLDQAKKLAEETIAPLNSTGDRQGCTFDSGEVTTPDGYKAAYGVYSESMWSSTAVAPELGGMGLPMPVAMAILEIFTGACPAFCMYPGLTTAAGNLLAERGSDWMKSIILPHLVQGDWAGTMCLTEPQAGSAVGDASTIAERDGDTYLLKGSKIFVSGGEHDLTENIIHLMLARTPDAPQGIKGLSLFMVPKFIVNDDGSLGERNDVKCVGIEHKMGINGSATCTLAVGDDRGARGWIVGDEGEGIKHMFLMMNEARIGVGVQGYAVASAAFGNALAYAKDRVQGTKLVDLKDAGAQRVAIIEHSDVRRMLLRMRSFVAGMRALGITLGKLAQEWHADPKSEEGEQTRDVLEVLTPICKAWCTDMGFEVTREAIQVYGGYGYIGEYPVEQHMRDAKIFSIYEGTNGIQAMDLLGRKMARKGGMAFMQTVQWLSAKVSAAEETGAFDTEVALLQKSQERLGAAAMHLSQVGMMGDQEGAVSHAVDMLALFGDVVIGALLAEQAAVAHGAFAKLAEADGIDLDDKEARAAWVEGNKEAKFYAGKADNLRFYTHQHLPRAASLLHAIKSTDRTVLEAIL
ncbi:MAG: acyl-CoA dehydrogenase [Deltaproteobacteria bacterium]|nr:acyl-CoA dehydrogenase [Deltaproteobacteria bacterium]